jgi:hypothetical protein
MKKALTNVWNRLQTGKKSIYRNLKEKSLFDFCNDAKLDYAQK